MAISVAPSASVSAFSSTAQARAGASAASGLPATSTPVIVPVPSARKPRRSTMFSGFMLQFPPIQRSPGAWPVYMKGRTRLLPSQASAAPWKPVNTRSMIGLVWISSTKPGTAAPASM